MQVMSGSANGKYGMMFVQTQKVTEIVELVAVFSLTGLTIKQNIRNFLNWPACSSFSSKSVHLQFSAFISTKFLCAEMNHFQLNTIRN